MFEIVSLYVCEHVCVCLCVCIGTVYMGCLMCISAYVLDCVFVYVCGCVYLFDELTVCLFCFFLSSKAEKA